MNEELHGLLRRCLLGDSQASKTLTGHLESPAGSSLCLLFLSLPETSSSIASTPSSSSSLPSSSLPSSSPSSLPSSSPSFAPSPLQTTDADLCHLAVILARRYFSARWHSLAPAVKAEARRYLVSLVLGSRDRGVARQAAAAVREVLAGEAVGEWAGILEALIAGIRSSAWAGYALAQAVKGVVGRGRAGGERRMLRELATVLAPGLVAEVEASLRPEGQDWGLAKDLVKAVCALVVGGGAASGDDGGPIRACVLSLLGLLRALTETAFPPHAPGQEQREKMVHRIGKMLIELQKEQPVFSASILPEQLSVFGSHVLESDRYLFAHHGHVVQALWFLRVCLNPQTYSGCGDAAAASLDAFFTPGAQQALLLRSLLCSLLLLRQADLVRWHEDPEGFCDEAENVGDMEVLRPGAEALYLALIEAHAGSVVPLVLDFARSYYTLGPAGEDLAAAAINDACLQALGLGVYYLHDHLDYAAFYAGTLAPLLADARPEAALSRRRAVWFVGRWAGEVRQDMFDQVYAAVTALLEDRDRVVSLTAMAALRLLVDEWSFQADLFLPHLELALKALVALARRAAEPETRVGILNTVSLILDRMQDRIGPAAHAVTALIPDLWAFACETEFGLLKTAVVSACTQLVVALGREARACYPVALPLLAHSIDLSQPDAVYILDAGLQLWAAVVTYVGADDDPAIQQALLPLFPALASVIAQGFEHLKLATHITEAYVLLFGERFVALYAPSIASIARSTLGHVRDAGAAMIASALDTLLVAAPVESMKLLLEPPSPRTASAAITIPVNSSGDNSSSNAPGSSAAGESLARTLFRLAFDPTESDLAKSMHAALLGRMLLTDLPALSRGLEGAGPDPLLSLAKQTVALFMCLDIPRKRRLAALALTQLASPATPQDLLLNMVEIAQVSLEDDAAGGPEDPRIYDLARGGLEGDQNDDTLAFPSELEPLSEKMADLLARDPVILADLRQIATGRLQSLPPTPKTQELIQMLWKAPS